MAFIANHLKVKERDNFSGIMLNYLIELLKLAIPYIYGVVIKDSHVFY